MRRQRYRASSGSEPPRRVFREGLGGDFAAEPKSFGAKKVRSVQPPRTVVDVCAQLGACELAVNDDRGYVGSVVPFLALPLTGGARSVYLIP